MLDVSSTYYSFVSVNCNVVKRQDDTTYSIGYLFFIDEYYYAEVTTQKSRKSIIEYL